MAGAPTEHTRNRPHAPLPGTLGLIGTLVLCAAAMTAHLSPVQLKPVAAVMWILGFATQAAAFMLALARRRAGR